MRTVVMGALLVVAVVIAALAIVDLRSTQREAQRLRQQVSKLQHRTARHRPASRDAAPGAAVAAHGVHAAARVLVTVAGLDYVYSPARVVIKKGETVRWISKTAAAHSITSARRKLFTQVINGYGSIEFTFVRSGTFRYYCIFHPYMQGVIVVRP